ncbi:MAG: glycosyltransferase family 2 protein [Snowella sp.]|nr:glycosyltransferase family 2 protein [Snowella sp.]
MNPQNNQEKNEMLMSVVITCYREEKLLNEAVDSVMNQTLLPKEIIIVNDASSHVETNQVCQELEKNSAIRLVWRDENGGPSVARNHGFQIATGEILVPLDADDLLPVNALQLIYNAFAQNPNIGFVYGNYSRQDRSHTLAKIITPGDIALAQTLKAKPFSVSTHWQLLGSGPMRRSLWQTLEGYDPNFGVEDLHDLEFWLRAIAAGVAYSYIPEVIYIWRKYLGGNTQQVTPIAWYRIAKKYFDIYQSVGLQYRAIELILLGAKWNNNSAEVKDYSRQLWQCILAGQFQFSSLIILFIPSCFFNFLIKNRFIKR